MIPAARAVVRAAVEDAQRDHVDEVEEVVARIEAGLQAEGWIVLRGA
ncbi:hypothetical protein ACFWAA_33540 [Streptomyces sp. NPDC059922]